MEALFTAMAWTMALCSGLMAGTYLAFSGFIMKSFERLGSGPAIAAMNAINVTILKSSFMPLFFGSSMLAALMVLLGLWSWDDPGSGHTVVAGLVYGIGMFAITATANVPLNNALAKVAGDGEAARALWARYLKRWTRWNTARTIASLATLAVCIDLLAR